VLVEKVDLEMRRISGKLNEHFAFLKANWSSTWRHSCIH